MTDYTKTTDFGVKDGLSTGNAAKLVKGSEFDTEFDAIETAVATKADKASPTFTGTVTGANVTVNGTFKLADTSDDHYYTWAVNELTADRTVTWPLLTGNDTIVFEAHTATLTNKTIDLTSNTLTGSAAEFDAALESDTFVFTSEVGSVVQAYSADNVVKTGTPVDDQVAVWTGANTLEGSSKLTLSLDGSNWQWLDVGSDTTVAGIKINTTILAYEFGGTINLSNIGSMDTATLTTIANNLESPGRHKGTTTKNSSTHIQLATAMFTDNAHEYVLRIRHLIPGTDNVPLELEASTDTGSTWLTSYRQSAADVTKITICSGVGSDVNEDGVSGEIHLVRPRDASDYNHIWGHGMYVDTSGNPQRWEIAATVKTTSNVDGLRLRFNGGSSTIDTTNGNISVYAIRTDT